MFVSMGNPSIYKIEDDTLLVVSQALNAIILLVIPFLLGIVGASARILIATVRPELKGNLLISSGLMATFSWIGIKSGVLISIIAPHLEKASIAPERTLNSAHDFYTMAFVAILVGMFSTSLYLIVSEKVEQITQQVQNKKIIEKKNKKTDQPLQAETLRIAKQAKTLSGSRLEHKLERKKGTKEKRQKKGDEKGD
ncbi:hypothetical protein [Pseudomonas monsensis]|uniref:hypothetical protein n=1 Tax=Pseudomonas monsensis TaxID=2745509 RepID=UPI002AB8C488|nr:hypothetical protein [Pseudomonas monsensis]MDZ3826086.1 hypothetical protein [Pseudomonas monsensis]